MEAKKGDRFKTMSGQDVLVVDVELFRGKKRYKLKINGVDYTWQEQVFNTTAIFFNKIN